MRSYSYTKLLVAVGDNFVFKVFNWKAVRNHSELLFFDSFQDKILESWMNFLRLNPFKP